VGCGDVGLHLKGDEVAGTCAQGGTGHQARGRKLDLVGENRCRKVSVGLSDLRLIPTAAFGRGLGDMTRFGNQLHPAQTAEYGYQNRKNEDRCG
jgi:hypothetical protein